MKIAIIGAGFTGCSIALKLSEKHQVSLFEKEKEILSGASAYNQMRFHQGYHYPRSQKTINEIKSSKKNFIDFYGKKIFGKTINYYAIPKKGSKTSPRNYEFFLRKNKLPFKKIDNKKYFSKNISISYKVNEEILNYFYFKKKVKKLIKNSNIDLKLGKKIKKKTLVKYDKVIISCYSENNNILKDLDIDTKSKFRYELVEKIIVKLPNKFKNKSFVIIDGKFVCCDPYLGTGFHLLSEVAKSKIEIVNGKYPIFKSKKKIFINKKPRKRVSLTLFKKFINKSSLYLPFLKEAKYIKSMYTVRTIKLKKEKTDERTNYFRKINNKIFVVLTGKWNTSINIAEKLNKFI